MILDTDPSYSKFSICDDLISNSIARPNVMAPNGIHFFDITRDPENVCESNPSFALYCTIINGWVVYVSLAISWTL